VTVLLWGFAAARRVNLMMPDVNGNNPVHYAALADTPEVRASLLAIAV
jgi:DNA-binding helix-hairpin-helix protein with protein kinase domain